MNNFLHEILKISERIKFVKIKTAQENVTGLLTLILIIY